MACVGVLMTHRQWMRRTLPSCCVLKYGVFDGFYGQMRQWIIGGAFVVLACNTLPRMVERLTVDASEEPPTRRAAMACRSRNSFVSWVISLNATHHTTTHLRFERTATQLPGRALGPPPLHLRVVVGGETTRTGESGRTRGLLTVTRCQVGFLEKRRGHG